MKIVNSWKSIIIHHSLTKDSKTVSMAAIRDYHTKTLGWDDIGYHFVIELVNGEYEIMAGRPLNIQGAHTKGKNDTAIGICCVGNYDVIEPPLELRDKLARHVAGLCWAFKISTVDVRAHRDYADKTCPGKMFEMALFRARVLNHIYN